MRQRRGFFPACPGILRDLHIQSFKHASRVNGAEKTVVPDFSDLAVICRNSSQHFVKNSLMSSTVGDVFEIYHF